MLKIIIRFWDELKESNWVKRIVYFFPVQLFFVQLRYNLLTLFFWYLLFSFVTSSTGSKFGIPFLFLQPEYLGDVGFWSYFILGFSCGGFIMAYHVSSFLLNGWRFPFLVTTARPFSRYCLNNSIFPLLFLGVYSYELFGFYFFEETVKFIDTFLYFASFGFGNFVFISLSLSFFLSRNKDILTALGLNSEDDLSKPQKRIKISTSLFDKVDRSITNQIQDWKVETYLTGTLKIRRSREASHYDPKILRSIFKHNFRNGTFFVIMVVVTLVFLGSFGSFDAFMLPSGATIFLLLTMIMLIFSALSAWLKGWFVPFLVISYLLANNLYQNGHLTSYVEIAGMQYNDKLAAYTRESLNEHSKDTAQISLDYKEGLVYLENWKRKNQKPNNVKPKLLLICSSGGGLRATYWTFYTLQKADLLSNGKLFNQTAYITGSSGGIIGASFFRELRLRKHLNSNVNPYDFNYYSQISNDLLNPVTFNLATHDLYLKFKKYNYGDYEYGYNRAFAFEDALNKNTERAFSKSLKEYYDFEKLAIIPMMVFNPVITADGRRLTISAQNISHLTSNTSFNKVFNSAIAEEIEFKRFFKAQKAENARLSSLLRTNATFPYIFPNTILPSHPSINAMDAGLRDNYGILNAIKFLFVYRNWIKENTSGAVILVMRDKAKDFALNNDKGKSLLSSVINPIGNFYLNFDKVQTYNYDLLLQYASGWSNFPLNVIEFELQSYGNKEVSMSWHLTGFEKKQVKNSLYHEKNIQQMKNLMDLLEVKPSSYLLKNN